jgi:hypothetical protein
MANADNVRIAKDAAGTMRRASRLAERMARVLRDEEDSDVPLPQRCSRAASSNATATTGLKRWICLKLFVALKTARRRRRAMVQARA